MSITKTYANGAVTAGAQTVILKAFTNPATTGISANTIMRFASGEYCLITDASNSPSLGVVRGYWGTTAVAHNLYEGITYGLVTEAWPAAVQAIAQVAPVTVRNAEEVTLTGTTGTDAAQVTAPWPAFLNCSGASGAGVNLPVPQVGASYWVKNSSSGTMKIYCVGGTITTTTGTTAITLTTTGTTAEQFTCSTSGTWQIEPVAV